MWIQEKDPVKNFRKAILEHGVISEAELEKVEADIEQEIEDVVEYAKNAPLPTHESALKNIYWEG